MPLTEEQKRDVVQKVNDSFDTFELIKVLLSTVLREVKRLVKVDRSYLSLHVQTNEIEALVNARVTKYYNFLKSLPEYLRIRGINNVFSDPSTLVKYYDLVDINFNKLRDEIRKQNGNVIFSSNNGTNGGTSFKS